MLLLDTCTLLWVASGGKELSQVARTAILKYPDQLYISSISALEVALKHKRKKLKLPLEPTEWFKEVVAFHGIRELVVNSETSILAASLPDFHNDPFDRLIIAAGLINNLTILTPDKTFEKYPDVIIDW